MASYTINGTYQAIRSGVLQVRYITFAVVNPGTVTISGGNGGSAGNGDDARFYLFRADATSVTSQLVGTSESSDIFTLSPGLYAIALSEEEFTEAEARAAENPDDDTPPFTYNVTVTEGSALITPPADGVIGTDNSETLTGTGQGELILGHGGNDTINAGGGGDFIDGGSNDDTVNGEGGNDLIRAAGLGFETVDGGDARDTLVVDWSHLSTSVSDFSQPGFEDGFHSNGGGSTLIYRNIEALIVVAGSGADDFTTGTSDDTVALGSGNDFVNLQTGDDSGDGGVDIDGFSADLSGRDSGISVDLVANTSTGDRFRNFEYFGTIVGTGFADTFVTQNIGRDETFSLGAGDDSVTVRHGFDRVAGGADTDTLIVDWSHLSTAVLNFGPAEGYEDGFHSSGGGATLLYSGIERLDVTSGSAADDFTTGDSDDVVRAGGGNDIIAAAGGNDRLEGGAGNDTLHGGGGNDTAVYSGRRADYTIAPGQNAGEFTITDNNTADGDEGTDTLTGIETLDFDDPVTLFDQNGNQVGEFATIAEAITAAQAGYRIVLDPGTYNETVIVNKDVTIEGPNAGTAGTATRVAEAIITGGVYMNAAGATLDGVTVQGGGTLAGNPAGIYVDQDNVTLTNLIIQRDGTEQIGILTPFNGGVEGLTLSRSLLTGWFQGAFFNPTTGFTADANRIEGNTIGLVGDDWADGTLIQNNVFNNNSSIHVAYGALDTVDDVGAYFGTGNTFLTGTRVVAIVANGDGDAGGQTLYGTDFNDSFSSAETGASGTDASFFGRGGNDRISAGSGNDTLNGGTGNDELRGGTGTDTATFADAITVAMLARVADAQPSAGGDQPGWTVTTTTEGTDSLTGVEIVEGAERGRSLLVGNDGFTSIQAAVDAAQDGDTILVAPGTYVENVTVNKDVTILGPNSGIAASGTRSAEAIIDGGVHMNAAGATLDGLTVLGGGTLAGNPAGIYVDQDNVTLTNLIVQGDGTAGTGIVTPSGGGVSGLTVSNSRIDDWTNGTYFNPTTQFILSGNSFDGNGVALTGDDWEDGTLISNNAFTNSSIGHVGYGVFDSVEVVDTFFGTGNTFDASGGRIGIFAYGDGTPGGQDISGTRFADYMAGVEYVAGSGNDAIFRGLGGNDQIDAGAGNDTLDGGEGDDTLNGQDGDDRIIASIGADTVDGGDDTDTLEADYSGATAAIVMSSPSSSGSIADGRGNSVAFASIEAFDLKTGSGNDVLYGGVGNDVFDTDGGNDRLFLQQGGDDRASGGIGNDSFYMGGAMTSDDQVDGGDGSDTLALQGDYSSLLTFGAGVVNLELIALLPGSDTRFGAPGTEFYDYNIATVQENVAAGALLSIDGARLRAGEDFTFNGSTETDGSFRIGGGRGTDLLTGGGRSDSFVFSGATFGADDRVNGGGGSDQLVFQFGATVSFGETQLTSIELIALTSGQAVRAGNTSYDITTANGNVASGQRLGIDAAQLRVGEVLVFNGSAEADGGTFRVAGGASGDTIRGGQSGDILEGRGGADELTGNLGNDRFLYREASHSNPNAQDRITDFTLGDLIDLSGIDARSGGTANDSFTFIGSNAFTNQQGQLRVEMTSLNTYLVQGDVDGNGSADLQILVNVADAHPLTAADFVL